MRKGPVCTSEGTERGRWEGTAALARPRALTGLGDSPPIKEMPVAAATQNHACHAMASRRAMREKGDVAQPPSEATPRITRSEGGAKNVGANYSAR